MKEITVTMPLEEFEIMRSKIEALKGRDVRQYVKAGGFDNLSNGFVSELDLDALIEDLKVDYPNLRVK